MFQVIKNQLRIASLCIGVAMAALGIAATANADQTAPELPQLFEQLRTTEVPVQAAEVEQAIWGHWLTGPDEQAGRLMQQIQASLQLGRYDLGLVLSNQLVDAYPSYAEAWNKRATIFYLMDRVEASVEDIKKTLELEPRHFGALSGLGLILMKTGDPEGALLAFEEVLTIAPLSESAALNASLARDRLGTDI
jgi:tetratricopeptide (TPR) repeat protein